jgi:hypothetical protein
MPEMELSHVSMVETEVTSQNGVAKKAPPRWRRPNGDAKMSVKDGGPRRWVKSDVNASTAGDEMTRSGVRGSHLACVNRLGCVPGRQAARPAAKCPGAECEV